MIIENVSIIQHYEIIFPLCKSGTGEVFLATDMKPGKIAIKFLIEEFSKDSDKLRHSGQDAVQFDLILNISAVYLIRARVN